MGAADLYHWQHELKLLRRNQGAREGAAQCPGSKGPTLTAGMPTGPDRRERNKQVQEAELGIMQDKNPSEALAVAKGTWHLGGAEGRDGRKASQGLRAS